MDFQKLLLEITRKCTLLCEHCLRGDSQNTNISRETIINTFKDIENIDTLVLTGGEPLLSLDAIEEIIKLIKSNRIHVGQVLLVTNGTVLNSRVLKVLKELREVTNLELFISYDIFHALSLERQRLTQKRDDNAEVLKELFGAKEYGKDTKYKLRVSCYIVPKGRAKTISEKRLKEVGSLMNINFSRDTTTAFPDQLFYKDNKLCGGVTIDVFGNVVKEESSYEDEDSYSIESNTNVNEVGLFNAVTNHMENIRGEKYYDPPKRKFKID